MSKKLIKSYFLIDIKINAFYRLGKNWKIFIYVHV